MRRGVLLGRRSLLTGCAMGLIPRASGASAQTYREPWAQPFSDGSVWNIPVGSDAEWSDTSDPGTAQILGARFGMVCTEWSQPHFIGSAADPVVTVRCTDTTFPVLPQRIHIPASARPAAGADKHMNFFDRTNPRRMWSYWGCKFENGRDATGGITAGLGGVSDTCGDGIRTLGKGYGIYNFGIGTVRTWELAADGVRHVLRYSVSPDIARMPRNTGRPGVDWLTDVPWPDRNTDYWGDRDYKGKLIYGATIGIPHRVDLRGLGLSRGGAIIATTLQQYGAIMRDTGGNNQVQLYVDPACAVRSPELVEQIYADMHRIGPHLRVLKNQGSTSINGGGRPLVPGPPRLDPLICAPR